MDKIPWDLIVSVIVAVLGSSGLWSYIDKHSNKSRFTKIAEAIKRLEQKVEDIVTHESTDMADRWRGDILRFDAELRRSERHTFEEWEEVVSTMDKYQRYCKDHPTYPNMRAENAIANIGEKYKACKEQRDFL